MIKRPNKRDINYNWGFFPSLFPVCRSFYKKKNPTTAITPVNVNPGTDNALAAPVVADPVGVSVDVPVDVSVDVSVDVDVSVEDSVLEDSDAPEVVVVVTKVDTAPEPVEVAVAAAEERLWATEETPLEAEAAAEEAAEAAEEAALAAMLEAALEAEAETLEAPAPAEAEALETAAAAEEEAPARTEDPD